MDEISTLIAKRYFKEYYFKFGDKIKPPSEISSREFGYLPFGGSMVRHLSFRDIGALIGTLVREAPSGVYCSNSLYSDPDAEMHLKGWRSAELIFDIDADALKLPCKNSHDVWFCKGCGKKQFGKRPETCPDCEGNRILVLSWVCKKCLEGTKREAFKLLEFLEFDFGIPPAKTKVYFSGSAGYHIMVERSTYDLLDTHGRAEIADYLTAHGMTSSLFSSQRLSPSDPGWRGRIARFIRDLPQEDKMFKSSEYLRRLFEVTNEFSKSQIEEFMQRAISGCASKIDPMVTTDIHRIFRVAETLNNKTGLVKRECTLNLDSFDPSIDPIAVRDSGKSHVMVDIAPKIEMGGVFYGPFESEQAELPLYAAIYLVLKGAARFVKEKSILQKEVQRANP